MCLASLCIGNKTQNRIIAGFQMELQPCRGPGLDCAHSTCRLKGWSTGRIWLIQEILQILQCLALCQPDDVGFMELWPLVGDLQGDWTGRDAIGELETEVPEHDFSVVLRRLHL